MTSKSERERKRKEQIAQRAPRRIHAKPTKSSGAHRTKMGAIPSRPESELSETSYLIRMTKGTHNSRKVSMPKFSWDK